MKALFSLLLLSASATARFVPNQITTQPSDESLEKGIVRRQTSQSPSIWNQPSYNQQPNNGWGQQPQNSPTPVKSPTIPTTAAGMGEALMGVLSVPFGIVGGLAQGIGTLLGLGNAANTTASASSTPFPVSPSPYQQQGGGYQQGGYQQGGYQQPQQQQQQQQSSSWNLPPAPSPAVLSPPPSPTPSAPWGSWISNLFGGTSTTSTSAPAKPPVPSPTAAADNSTDVDEENVTPRYVQCEGNTWSGKCPNEHVCVGDPRSRGLMLDSICVPTKMSCGGNNFQICSANYICVSDPRQPNCQPWKGDVGCMGICV